MAQFPLVAVEMDTAGNTFDSQNFAATGVYLAGSIYPLNPTIGGSVTGMIRSLNIRRGKQSSLNRFEAGTMTLVLDNRDGRFDPANPSSPFASSFAFPERRIRVRAWYNRMSTDQALGTNILGIGVASNATVTLGTIPGSPGARVLGFGAYSLNASGAGTASGTMIYTTTVGYPPPLPPWDITKGFPVTPGETVTSVASYLCLGGITRNVTMTIQWRNAAGTIVSTTVGTAKSTGAVVWADDFITTTVPSNAVYASILYSWPAVGAAESVLVSCLGFWYGTDTNRLVATLAPGQPTTLNGTYQTAIWLFFGLADSFVNDFQHSYMATITIQAADYFRRFQAYPTQDLYAMEVLSAMESPTTFPAATGYWRLNEPAGSRTVSDMSGWAGAMYVTNAPGVTLGITPNTLTSPSNRSVSINTVGGLSGRLQNTGPKILMTFNTTVTFWCLFNSGVMLGNNCIVSTIDPGKTFVQGASTGIFVRDTSSTLGVLAVVSYSASGVVGQTFSLNGSTPIADGFWHHITVVFPSTSVGSFDAYVDGVFSGSSFTVDGVFINPSPWAIGTGTSCIGGSSDGVGGCTGQVDEVAFINRALSASEITSLYRTRTGDLASTPTSTGIWILRLLNMIRWGMGYLRSDPGDFSLTAMEDLQGSNLLEVLTNRIAGTEYGSFFIRADGQACFLSRSYTTTNSQPSIVFTDVNDTNYGVTKVPYSAIQRVRDEQFTYNDVVLSRHNGGTAESINMSKTLQYGLQKYTASTYDTDDGTLQIKADWLLNHFQSPRVRFPRITVNVAAYPAVAGAVIGRELMDWTMVIQTPVGMSSLQFTPTIIHIDHTISPDSWQVDFVMDTLDSVTETISTSIVYAQLDNPATAVLGTAQLA